MYMVNFTANSINKYTIYKDNIYFIRENLSALKTELNLTIKFKNLKRGERENLWFKECHIFDTVSYEVIIYKPIIKG